MYIRSLIVAFPVDSGTLTVGMHLPSCHLVDMGSTYRFRVDKGFTISRHTSNFKRSSSFQDLVPVREISVQRFKHVFLT